MNEMMQQLPPGSPKKWIGLAALGSGLLCTYFLLVFLSGDTPFGFSVSLHYSGMMILLSFLAIYGMFRKSYQQQWISIERLKDVTAATLVTGFSMIFVDILFSAYINFTTPSQELSEEQRLGDIHAWIGEGFPHSYYPTEKNFTVFKPNVKMAGESYGHLYHSDLLKSPTIKNSVLEFRHISYSIDEHGFRETTSLEEAHSFALGDSFTFGYGTDQAENWVELLEKKSGEPIYNLGVGDTSPKQQLMLLQYLLAKTPDVMRIKHLLWMIFEGNDLEDNYDTFQVRQPQNSKRAIFKDTFIEALTSLPYLLKSQSVLHRMVTGGITFRSPLAGNENNPYLMEGIPSQSPLFYSEKHGYRFFEARYIKNASQPESYVLEHPNMIDLDQTFLEMKKLSQQHAFKVTVLIAPSAARLYRAQFDHFPQISDQPHFINQVEKLSSQQDFEVINLYKLMQPYVEQELLYWRDDSHWNTRGNVVASEIIYNELQ